MTCHESLGVVSIDLTGHAHGAAADFTKQLILVVAVVLTSAEV